MKSNFPALWLNVSPALQRFDRPLLRQLCHYTSMTLWEYCQTPDEPMSLDVALCLLHDYLKPQDQPHHLIGHGTSGLLGLLYARQHPERVSSLTLLSVGVDPGRDWQAYYYERLQQSFCLRQTLLPQMVYQLFGHQPRPIVRELARVLEQDLGSALSLHTLYHAVSFLPGRVSVPLLICTATDDRLVDPDTAAGWQPWLKPWDRRWQCPSGRYFFHAFHADLVAEQISAFWQYQQLRKLLAEPLEIPHTML